MPYFKTQLCKRKSIAFQEMIKAEPNAQGGAMFTDGSGRINGAAVYDAQGQRKEYVWHATTERWVLVDMR